MEIKFKKIKFKDDSLSFKRFNQIIFENKILNWNMDGFLDLKTGNIKN